MSKKSIFNASAALLFDTDTSCFSAFFDVSHSDTAFFDVSFDNLKSLFSAEENAENKIQKSAKSKLKKKSKNDDKKIEKSKDFTEMIASAAAETNRTAVTYS